MPHIVKTKDTPGISLRYQRRLEGGQTHLPVRKNLHKKKQPLVIIASYLFYYRNECQFSLNKMNMYYRSLKSNHSV